MYESLLTFLHEEPLQTALADNDADDALDFETACLSASGGSHSVLVDTLAYFLRRRGLSRDETRLVRHQLGHAYMELAKSDLAVVKEIESSSKTVLKIATREYARSAAALGALKLLHEEGLEKSRLFLNGIDDLVQALPVR